MHKVIKLSLALILMNSYSNSEAMTQATAPVSGFAHSFMLNNPLPNATITILETGEKLRTDSEGRFGPIQYPIGKPITLLFEKFNYKTIQSGTFYVPKEGLTGPYRNITFQVPSIEFYYFLKAVVGGKENPNSCHLTSTIIAHNKTLNDVPQGVEGADVTITPNVNEKPFYFGIFYSGPLKDYTNPFTKGLSKTSEDGGVAYFNLPPSDKPYTLTARKSGVTFTSVKFMCTKGAFINISPPSGPMAEA